MNWTPDFWAGEELGGEPIRKNIGVVVGQVKLP